MKKHFFVGLISGLLLASAIPAYGAVSSLVGKQVQAENYVVVDNQILNVKAVNIDGTTYSPNRAIADALNMDIRFDDGKVYFESRSQSSTLKPTLSDDGGDELSANPLQRQIDLLQMKLSDEVHKYSALLVKANSDNFTEEDQKELDAVKSRMDEYQQQMDELQSQLEAQATPAQ